MKTTINLNIESIPESINCNDSSEVASYFGYGEKNTQYFTRYFAQNNKIYQLSAAIIYREQKSDDETIITPAAYYCYSSELTGISMGDSKESDITKDLLLEIVAAAHGKKLT